MMCIVASISSTRDALMESKRCDAPPRAHIETIFVCHSNTSEQRHRSCRRFESKTGPVSLDTFISGNNALAFLPRSLACSFVLIVDALGFASERANTNWKPTDDKGKTSYLSNVDVTRSIEKCRLMTVSFDNRIAVAALGLERISSLSLGHINH